jgi:hypothetical protein
VIDLRGARGSIADGIIVHGGDAAGEDLLAVFGGPRDRVNEIDDSNVEVGGTTITYTGLETVFVLAGPGSGFVNRLHGKSHHDLPDGRQAPKSKPGHADSLASKKGKTHSDHHTDAASTSKGNSTTTHLADGLFDRAFSGSLIDQLL